MKKKTQEKNKNRFKLSTLIRRGVERDGKQVRGKLFSLNAKGEIAGCCALGALALGCAGIPVKKLLKEALTTAKGEGWSPRATISFAEEEFNDMVEGELDSFLVGVSIPAENINKARAKFGGDVAYYQEDVGALIPELNDQKRWSREKIADFLQELGL